MKGKNLWLLGRDNAPGRQRDILEIIGSLREELGRGESVYAPDELRLLERKLEEYEQLLQSLSGP